MTDQDYLYERMELDIEDTCMLHHHLALIVKLLKYEAKVPNSGDLRRKKEFYKLIPSGTTSSGKEVTTHIEEGNNKLVSLVDVLSTINIADTVKLLQAIPDGDRILFLTSSRLIGREIVDITSPTPDELTTHYIERLHIALSSPSSIAYEPAILALMANIHSISSWPVDLRHNFHLLPVDYLSTDWLLIDSIHHNLHFFRKGATPVALPMFYGSLDWDDDTDRAKMMYYMKDNGLYMNLSSYFY